MWKPAAPTPLAALRSRQQQFAHQKLSLLVRQTQTTQLRNQRLQHCDRLRWQSVAHGILHANLTRGGMERDATLVTPCFRPAQSQATCIMSHPCCTSTARYGLGALLQQKPPLSVGYWPSKRRNPLFALVREEVAATSLLPNPPYTRYTLRLTPHPPSQEAITQ